MSINVKTSIGKLRIYTEIEIVIFLIFTGETKCLQRRWGTEVSSSTSENIKREKKIRFCKIPSDCFG